MVSQCAGPHVRVSKGLPWRARSAGEGWLERRFVTPYWQSHV